MTTFRVPERRVLTCMIPVVFLLAAVLAPSPCRGAALLTGIDLGSSIFTNTEAEFVELELQHFTLQVSKNLETLQRTIKEHPDDIALHIDLLVRMIHNDLGKDYDTKDILAYFQKISQGMESLLKDVETAKINMAFIHAVALEMGIKDQEEPWKQGIRAVCLEEKPETEAAAPPWKRLIFAYLCAAVPGLGDTDDVLSGLVETSSDFSHTQFMYALGQTFLTVYHDDHDHQVTARDLIEKSLQLGEYAPDLIQQVVDRYMQEMERYQEEQKDVPPWLSEILYVKMLELDPDDAVAHNNLGYLYANLGVKPDQALRHVKRANELSPNNPYFMDSLGWVLFKNGQTKEALDTLNKALEVNDSIPEIYEHISSVYLNTQGGERDSVKALEKLIELDPNNPTALNNLGYMYADMDIDYEESLNLTTRAVKLKPEDPYYLDSLGWAYFKLGDLVNARKYLLESVTVDSEQPELLDHIGDVELEEGNYDEALTRYVKAAGLNPEYDRIHQKIGVIYTISELQNKVRKYEEQRAAGETVEIDDFANNLRSLSYHYRMAGMFDLALSEYEKVLELLPDNNALLSRYNRIKKLNKEVSYVKNLLRGRFGDVPRCGQLERFIAPLPDNITILFLVKADVMAAVLESIKPFFDMLALIDFGQAVALLPSTTAVAVTQEQQGTRLLILSEVPETSSLHRALDLLLSGSLTSFFPDLKLKSTTVNDRTVTTFSGVVESMHVSLSGGWLVASTSINILSDVMDRLGHEDTDERGRQGLNNASMRRLLAMVPDDASASVYVDLTHWLPRLGSQAISLVVDHFPLVEDVTNAAIAYKLNLGYQAQPPGGDAPQHDAGPQQPVGTIEEHGIFLCKDRMVPEQLANTISTVLDHYGKTFGDEDSPLNVDKSFQVKAKYLIYSATLSGAEVLQEHIFNAIKKFFPKLPGLIEGTAPDSESEGEEDEEENETPQSPDPLDLEMY